MIAALHDARIAAGPQAAALLHLWQVMLWFCIGVFLAVMAVLLIALLRAPRVTPNTAADNARHPATDRRVFLAIAIGTALSGFLLFVLLVASFNADRAIANLPLTDPVHIDLVAHQFWWDARYDSHDPTLAFSTANELHIPVGRPVLLTLRSDDVIHSFWIPSLTGKKDMIPGRISTIAIRADKSGIYSGQCAEFCGYQHAHMTLFVFAEEPKAFDRWASAQRHAAQAPASERAQRGYDLVVNGTCAMCHAIRGTTAGAQRAPDLTHLAERKTLGAGTLANNRETLSDWIANAPQFKPGVNMPSMAYSPEDLGAMVDYLTALK